MIMQKKTEDRSVLTNPPSSNRLGLWARLGETELRRRIWHMAPGVLPLLLWPIPHEDPISPTLLAILILLNVAVGVAIYLKFGHIQRPGAPNDRLSAVAGYTGSVVATLLLFPGQPELGLTVLGVLAFGDGTATLGGLLLGGPTLPWNREKTWAGFLCFVLCGGAWASIIYWGEAQPAVSFAVALTCVMPAAAVAAVSESIPSRLNDNIRVGLSAAVIVATLHGIVVGWS